ncbi:PHA/PHB synthase family protein [Pseudovibrio exalbescens]|uniref:PHA/PHB synthase family protein n=1 Tax=Pseudovibrio exalbescens TaxID=197461 RepID=UPI000C99E576|nr:class I poly(R)-hydroxyalkanoic acid synthase [Pseudovibrio exalbescens]
MSNEQENPLLQYIFNNPEEFARNLTKIAENSGKALAAYLEPRESGRVQDETPEELSLAVKTLAQVGEYWMKDPARAIEAQTRLWTGYMHVWNNTLKRMAGEDSAPTITPAPGDKRFRDAEWEENQFFDFVKQMYLQTTQWAEHLVEGATDVDEHTRHKAAFYVRQITNAMAPSNFILTNPELLRETMTSNGENLVKGMEMLAEDIKAGNGEVKLRQSDPSSFEIGKNVANTPGKVIAQNDVCQLIQYEPQTEQVYKRPILVVPPWINKYYILDLNEEKSFIRWMVEQGHTVFVISWVNPDERQSQKSFEHYMQEGIFMALDTIQKTTQQSTVNAIGYCVGGTLLAIALAYMAKTGQKDRVATVTFLTTQVDFVHSGDLRVFVDEEQIKLLEDRMNKQGYLDGSKMATAFNMLRSNDLIWPYVINNYIRGKEPFPFDLLFWNSDATRLPAANHSFYLRNCYLTNNLAKGELEIDDIKIDLKDVEIPVYNLATREDHIAPAISVLEGSHCFGGPVEYVLAGSGHIAGVVNPPHKNKYQYWTNDGLHRDINDWLNTAEEHPGSWWPHWQEWITDKDNTLVKARKPGARRVKILEDAPGSYVKVRL